MTDEDEFALYMQRTYSEKERREDIQAAIRKCLEGYKPKPVKADLETAEEKAMRRRNVLEDAPKYANWNTKALK